MTASHRPPQEAQQQPSAAKGVQLARGRLRIKPERIGGCLAIHVAGEIDHETAGLLRAQVLTAAAPGPQPQVVLDLKEVTFCDSSGFAALAGIWKAIRSLGGEVLLASVTERCRHIMARTGLDRHLKIRSTLEQAIADLAAGTGTGTPHLP